MSAREEIIKTCFQDIISIKGGCGDIVSASGLYANDVDITPDFINEIINRSYKGETDFFEQKRDFAISSVIDEAMSFLTPKLKTASLLNDFRIGQFNDNLKIIAGDGSLKGINIDLCNSNSYLNVFVNEISLQVDKTGDVDVLVYDLIQNKILDTIKVACIANEVATVYPAKTYYSAKRKLNLLFAYDSTGINSNTTYINGGDCSSCRNKTKGIKNSYEYVHGAKISAASQKIKSNLTLLSETGGMSIVHSVQCNHRQWLCSYSNMLALPILYKFGELVMEFAINVSPNDRGNTTITINPDELKNRMEFFSVKYRESLNSVLSNIKTPEDSKCFHCRETIRHEISTL